MLKTINPRTGKTLLTNNITYLVSSIKMIKFFRSYDIRIILNFSLNKIIIGLLKIQAMKKKHVTCTITIRDIKIMGLIYQELTKIKRHN